MRMILMLASMLALSHLVRAEVYLCESDGKKVYTDNPCTPGDKPHQMPEISTVPSVEGIDLAEQYDARAKKSRQARDGEDKAWLKSHDAGKAREKKMREAIFDKRVLKDMSSDEVRLAIGSPDEVEYSGGQERWIYRNGRQKRVVTLQDGRVSAAGAFR